MTKLDLSAYGAVAAGSVIGSLLRWAAGAAALALLGPLPWGTLFVNLTGALAIGFFAARIDHPLARHFALTGLCGGFTTFSALSLETFSFFGYGQIETGALYAIATLAGSCAACWLGEMLGRRAS